ncbi:MAG TPA: hypothetical protein VGX23_34125 [Actinocrinis sp.]|nr:hypothetical protein [Actinocrinis sp.]
MSGRDILALPYSQRRLIVVTDRLREPSETPEPPTEALEIPEATKPAVVVMTAADAASQFLDTYILPGKLLYEVWRRKREGRERLMPVSTIEAQALKFPVGYPRKDLVYVGHPVDPATYIPVADFHRFLFEHKIAEAQRLVRSLGAVTINVIHIEGWDQAVGIDIDVSAPKVFNEKPIDVMAKASRNTANSQTILATMKLTPAKPPHIPDGLAWFSHEPLWQEVAFARLESGLNAFVIDVRSTDDFGVNANLRSLIAKSKLQIGGEFIQHRKTTWRLEGTFSIAEESLGA